MKKIFSFLSVAAALTLASCSSKTVGSEDAAKRLVAGEAPAFICSFKLKDLLDKGGISSKENIPMVAQIMFGEQVEYFTNPGKIGLDISGKSFFAVYAGEKLHSGWMVTGIKDKEAFEKTLKSEGNDKFEEIEGYNTLRKGTKLLAWNDKLLMITAVSEGDVKEKFNGYATMLGEKKSPADQFNKFFDTKTDIAIHYDYTAAATLQASMPQESRVDEQTLKMMKNVSERFKGSYSVVSINFENDKIVADVENVLTDAAKKELSFMGNTGFPKELLVHLGSSELTGFVSFNTDVQKMMDWLVSVSGNENMLAEMREQSGFDINQILASFKGNVLMAYQGSISLPIPNYNEEGELVASTDSMSQPRVTVIASLTNDYPQVLADSLLADKKENGYYALSKGFNAQYLGFKPSVLVFTNDPQSITGTGTPTLEAEAEKVFGKPFSFYFDINHLISMGGERMNSIAGKFRYAAGGMDINGGHAELILNNGGKNSLWTLINLGVQSTSEMMDVPNM